MARAPRYDAALKAEVVALAVEVGPAEAARQHAIKPTTVRSWCSRAGVATVASETTRAATEMRMAKWEERRTAMVHEIGDIASMALARVRTELGEDGKLRDAKDAATTMAILVDKAQLLSGGQTARFGTDPQRAAVVEEARTQALRLVG